MTNHPTDEELQLFYDGELSEAEETKIEAHVEHCETCQNILSEYLDISDTYRELCEEEIQNFSLEGIEEEIQTKIAPTAKNTIPFLSIFKGLSVAAVFIFAVYLSDQVQNPPTLNSPQVAIRETPNPRCEVDYFYTQSNSDIMYYEVDADTKVLWVLEPSNEKET